ncbi:hypothetical protein E2C01_094881 [Portunus trituberculatus]|uniref:Uncharacterized protein n=1 Tax=Portunus trituberculatus TaxID=210409 RepID=A0A5B7K232_PORTR|nr:hypothetical protein [Portunus trituberculatus]
MQISGSLYWSVSSNINSSAFMGFSGRVRTGGLPDTHLAGPGGLSGGPPGGAVKALSLKLSGVYSSWVPVSRRHCKLKKRWKSIGNAPPPNDLFSATCDPFSPDSDPVSAARDASLPPQSRNLKPKTRQILILTFQEKKSKSKL